MAGPAPVVPSLPLRADLLQINALFEELVDEGFSEEFFRHHTGQQNLEEIESLELQVDAVSGSQRCEMIGELLPSLLQLRMSQSRICTIRDLGTSLSNLKVLWLCRSSVQDLGGITNMPVLEELYLAFNDVRDLSPLWTHETLQVLDLEGNLVDDFEEIRVLQAMSSLRELNLSMNPVWKQQGLTRKQVLDALPQLEVLDDVPRDGEPPQPGDAAPAEEVPSDDASCASSGRAAEAPVREEGPCRALLALRARSTSGGPRRGAPCAPRDGPAAAPRAPRGASRRRASEEGAARRAASEAVAALREGCARLREPRDPQPLGLLGEPSEQELVLEGLKRAPRPNPSMWGCAKTARADFAGAGCGGSSLYAGGGFAATCGGFFPHGRAVSARPSTGSASTSYRPATASSSTSAAATGAPPVWASGVAAEEAASSDLTVGEDGSALVGNPLGAVRRRRRVGSGEAVDGDLGIRSLLRRYEASAAAEAERPKGALVEGAERPQTPDVRIRAQPPSTPRPTTPRGLAHRAESPSPAAPATEAAATPRPQMPQGAAPPRLPQDTAPSSRLAQEGPSAPLVAPRPPATPRAPPTPRAPAAPPARRRPTPTPRVAGGSSPQGRLGAGPQAADAPTPSLRTERGEVLFLS